MPERTEAEWRDLARRLKEVANDPEEEKVRRQRALAILETIPKEFRFPRQPPIDYEFPADGQIV